MSMKNYEGLYLYPSQTSDGLFEKIVIVFIR